MKFNICHCGKPATAPDEMHCSKHFPCLPHLSDEAWDVHAFALLSRISALEAENTKLRESVSSFSGTLGEETQKRYALEAERGRAVELLRMSLHSGVGVQDYQLREHIESFLASIGGEGKNG